MNEEGPGDEQSLRAQLSEVLNALAVPWQELGRTLAETRLLFAELKALEQTSQSLRPVLESLNVPKVLLSQAGKAMELIALTESVMMGPGPASKPQPSPPDPGSSPQDPLAAMLKYIRWATENRERELQKLRQGMGVLSAALSDAPKIWQDISRVLEAWGAIPPSNAEYAAPEGLPGALGGVALLSEKLQSAGERFRVQKQSLEGLLTVLSGMLQRLTALCDRAAKG